MHIRFEEIASVNFARSGGSTRSFDFEVELKSSTIHTFSSIEKEEYNKLFDFITTKKIHVKNTGKTVLINNLLTTIGKKKTNVLNYFFLIHFTTLG